MPVMELLAAVIGIAVADTVGAAYADKTLIIKAQTKISHGSGGRLLLSVSSVVSFTA